LTFARLGINVRAVDLDRRALDLEVAQAVSVHSTHGEFSFIEACLWQRRWTHATYPFDWAYCCDVLEHIPTEFTMLVVERCLQAASRSFLHINFDPDHFGQTIGEPLHLTVQPFTWWRDRLADLASVTDARDLLGHGFFVLENR
jgi:hypothetical protein